MMYCSYIPLSVSEVRCRKATQGQGTLDLLSRPKATVTAAEALVAGRGLRLLLVHIERAKMALHLCLNHVSTLLHLDKPVFELLAVPCLKRGDAPALLHGHPYASSCCIPRFGARQQLQKCRHHSLGSLHAQNRCTVRVFSCARRSIVAHHRFHGR